MPRTFGHGQSTANIGSDFDPIAKALVGYYSLIIGILDN